MSPCPFTPFPFMIPTAQTSRNQIAPCWAAAGWAAAGWAAAGCAANLLSRPLITLHRSQLQHTYALS